MSRVITNRKIKVALVGCGRIAQKHFESLNVHEKDMELVAVCDTVHRVLAASSAVLNVQGSSQ